MISILVTTVIRENLSWYLKSISCSAECVYTKWRVTLYLILNIRLQSLFLFKLIGRFNTLVWSYWPGLRIIWLVLELHLNKLFFNNCGTTWNVAMNKIGIKTLLNFIEVFTTYSRVRSMIFLNGFSFDFLLKNLASLAPHSCLRLRHFFFLFLLMQLLGESINLLFLYM